MSISASPLPQAGRWAFLATPAALLSFGAAPTFAVMAVVAGGPADAAPVTCFGMASSPLAGMAWMYVLMCVFHLPPWLRLLAGRATERSA